MKSHIEWSKDAYTLIHVYIHTHYICIELMQSHVHILLNLNHPHKILSWPLLLWSTWIIEWSGLSLYWVALSSMWPILILPSTFTPNSVLTVLYVLPKLTLLSGKGFHPSIQATQWPDWALYLYWGVRGRGALIHLLHKNFLQRALWWVRGTEHSDSGTNSPQCWKPL